jgi:hypothetical protein
VELGQVVDQERDKVGQDGKEVDLISILSSSLFQGQEISSE